MGEEPRPVRIPRPLLIAIVVVGALVVAAVVAAAVRLTWLDYGP